LNEIYVTHLSTATRIVSETQKQHPLIRSK